MCGVAVKPSLSKKAFLTRAETLLIPPLYAEIPYAEPYLLYPKFSGPGSILFESVRDPIISPKAELLSLEMGLLRPLKGVINPKISGYSFIGFEPYIVFSAKDGSTEIKADGRRTVSNKHPLKKLRELLNAYRQFPEDGLPPFQGGAMGLFCYDFVRYIESVPCSRPDTLNLPDAHFLFIDRLISFDHARKKAWAIVCPGVRGTQLGYKDLASIDWMEKYDEAEETLNTIATRACGPPTRETETVQPREIEVAQEMSKERYVGMVEKAKEYIAAGDIFQANLSLRVSARIGETSPWSLYTALRAVNPSPFASFMDFGDYQIVGSSPERLMMVRNGIVETRPIAGTRPRGKDGDEDEAMRSELLLNEKERAEHIMLIDLERNDAGKISDYGSVSVDELMTTEDYSHVIHIVSNIKGRLASRKDSFDAIRAFFPGGTITGVPKVRCMEIIDELEPVRRGPYTGSAGYFGFSGCSDFNIVIRTFLIKDRTAYVQAGAGIVADSVPEKEHAESLKKAEALIKSLTLAGKKLV